MFITDGCQILQNKRFIYVPGERHREITFSKNFTSIHTYIIGHYNPSVRIIDLVSHTTYVVSVNFIHSGGIYSLKSTPNDKFVEKLLMAIIFTLGVFATNLLRGNRRGNTFRISFLMSGLGLEPWLFV